jgi:hypothetical protein
MDLGKFKPKIKQIGPMTVEVVPFAARRAIALKFRLLKELGPTIVGTLKGVLSAVSQTADSKYEFSFDKLNAEDIPNNLFDGIDPCKLVELIEALLASTRVNNTEMTGQAIDELFTTEYGNLYKVLFFVLEVNFKDFFEPLTINKKGK